MEAPFTYLYDVTLLPHRRQILSSCSGGSSLAEAEGSSASSLSPSDLNMESFASHSFDPGSPDDEDTVYSNDNDVDHIDGSHVQLLAPKSEGHQDAQALPVVKRGRGRPRKAPVETVKNKGRSKTGCITCRKRKKKCDETRPSCLNCQKNNAICGGYPPRAKWQARDKVTGRAMPRDLPVLIDGLKDDMDTRLLDHFAFKLSALLNPWREENTPNPFTDLLLPMAIQHRGLMHSLLCLSATHLGASEHPQGIEEKQWDHFGLALEHIRRDESLSAFSSDPTHEVNDPTIAATVILVVNSAIAGERRGEYKIHVDAANSFLGARRAQPTDIDRFLRDCLQHINMSTCLTSAIRPVLHVEQGRLPNSPTIFPEPLPYSAHEPKANLSVLFGLAGPFARVLDLRHRVRQRRRQNIHPHVDYAILSDAQAVDAKLRHWSCPWPNGSPRSCASLLYRQCVWIYLHQTISHSMFNENVREAIDTALAYIAQLETSPGTQALLLMPLFILGCVAQADGQRRRISHCLDRLYEYRMSGNVRLVTEFIASRWQSMSHGAVHVPDWEDLLEHEAMDFLII